MSTFTPQQTLAIQATGIATSLITSGALFAISLINVPLMRSTSTKDSLPFLKQLFSTGSHTFPPAASLATGSFALLAYNAPTSVLKNRYLLAAGSVISIVPFTFLVMKGPNMELMSIKEKQDEQGEEGVSAKGGENRVQELLQTFKWENMVRGVLVAAGGVVGLVTALGY